jgi:Na+/phosphate symporter
MDNPKDDMIMLNVLFRPMITAAFLLSVLVAAALIVMGDQSAASVGYALVVGFASLLGTCALACLANIESHLRAMRTKPTLMTPTAGGPVDAKENVSDLWN